MCKYIHVQSYTCCSLVNIMASFVVLVWEQVGRGAILYTVKYAYLPGSPWHMISSLKCHGYHWPVMINLMHLNQPLFHDVSSGFMQGESTSHWCISLTKYTWSLFPFIQFGQNMPIADCIIALRLKLKISILHSRIIIIKQDCSQEVYTYSVRSNGINKCLSCIFCSVCVHSFFFLLAEVMWHIYASLK